MGRGRVFEALYEMLARVACRGGRGGGGLGGTGGARGGGGGIDVRDIAGAETDPSEGATSSDG